MQKISQGHHLQLLARKEAELLAHPFRDHELVLRGNGCKIHTQIVRRDPGRGRFDRLPNRRHRSYPYGCHEGPDLLLNFEHTEKTLE